ncbi:guanine nucleotide-binding protein g(o) subunit alpha [Anaeramoeba flamelloides]|uniref:Guanine nucleotide-binding protein g(O) subunit alpha n=1 Tax=Anaeramoeba flamelloides TaxID=1746091 RepID=A0AAV7ZFL3_9EUKA|nr:guanine nucleotide-binding protein g(o) subunit alpha [Anaeramoeba flamelloides]
MYADDLILIMKGPLISLKINLESAGESGKSTIAKQMKLIHGNGFTKQERKKYQRLIEKNYIYYIQTLIEASKESNIENFDSELLDIVKEVEALEIDRKMTKDLAEKIQKVWESENLQKIYDRFESYHLPESTEYFFNKIEDFAKEDYLPTDEDIFKSRNQTTGVTQIEFQSSGQNFTIIDVGGQRNERRKWINHFENVTAVLFVTSLSEYNQVLFEDEEVNRMNESLELFFEQCNSRWFNDVDFILFLNKMDLFEKKISAFPLKELFSEYDGGDDLDNAKEFIKQKFLEQSKNKRKTIYTHFTTATDTKMVKNVFNIIRDIILNKTLPEIGYI